MEAPPLVPPAAPPVTLSALIRELDRRGRARGWSVADVAASIGVHRTRLVHMRRGTARLSLSSLHEIARQFPDDTAMRDLVWGYLTFDVPCRRRCRAEPRAAPPPPDPAAVAVVRRVLLGLPSLLVSGGGLAFVDPSPARLARVLDTIEAACRAQGVGVARERASAAVGGERRRLLLAIPVLLLDGAASVRPSVASVVAHRLDGARLTLTTWRDPGGIPPPPLDRFRRLPLPRANLASC